MAPTQPRRPRPRRRGLVGAAVVAVVVLAVLVALPAGAETRRPPARVRTEGTALAPAGDGLDTTGSGQVVPTLSVRRDRGPRMVIAADGRAKVVLFLSGRCPLCRREISELRRWSARGYPLPGSDRLDYYTVVEREKPDASYRSARKGWESWPTPVLRDDSRGTAAGAYGLGSAPMYVLVAADGTLIARYSGALGVEGVAALLRRFGLVPEPGSPMTTASDPGAP